jgi:hypothetical protein
VSAAAAIADLDDAAGLLEADRDGLLRAAATAGARVRATAAAVEEGALESVTGGQRPRTLIWVAGRGTAEAAGAMLAALLGGSAGEPVVLAAEAPIWVGPLDAVVVAGDDAGDPALVTAAATAVRRGARVVIAAPFEGPLRDATAGRAAVLAPRMPVPDEFGLAGHLAAGLAAAAAVDPPVGADLGRLADELDAEALRNSAGREVFTNPAKTLAGRMAGRQVILSGDGAAPLALARHGSAVLLRVAGRAAAAVGLADVIAAWRDGAVPGTDGVADLFHDEEFDGPRRQGHRVVALAPAAQRAALEARTAGLADVELLGAGDIAEAPGGEEAPGAAPPADAAETELAVLALRIEMAAVYLRLTGG